MNISSCNSCYELSYATPTLSNITEEKNSPRKRINVNMRENFSLFFFCLFNMKQATQTIFQELSMMFVSYFGLLFSVEFPMDEFHFNCSLSSMICVVLIKRKYDQCSGLWRMLSITCSCLFCEKIILFIKLIFFQFYMDDCLQRLIDRIDTDGSLKNLTPSDCISKLIRFRLEMQAPYISTWPQALSIQVSACPFFC